MSSRLNRAALLKVGVLVGLWTAYGFLCAWQAHYWYALSARPMSWGEAFRYELTYAYLWGAFTPLIRWFAPPVPAGAKCLASPFGSPRGRYPGSGAGD